MSVRAQLIVALIAASCRPTEPPIAYTPPETWQSRGDRFYCAYEPGDSFSRTAPVDLLPVDVDASAVTLACREAQSRLNDAGAPNAERRAADDALRRACLARRCVLWNVAVSVSQRDIIRYLCQRAALERIDADLRAAFDQRAALGAANPPANTEVAFASLVERANATRQTALECVGETVAPASSTVTPRP